MAQKRERSINFTREEIEILIKLVGDNKHVLENKKSDAITWNEKEKCWKVIEQSFNSTSGVTHRTGKTLRLKYEGIKRETRKKCAIIRAETYRTGGGSNRMPTLTCTEEKVKQMILLSVQGMESDFDSDRVPNAVTVESVPLECNLGHCFGLDSSQLNSAPEIIPCPNIELDITLENDIIKEPVRLTERTLFDNHLANDVGEMESTETNNKWSKWKPSTLRSKKHPALSKPKPMRPFEKVAESKLEVSELQKIILEEELVQNRKKWTFEEKERDQQQKRWDFEEEERQHKRELWSLEKEMMLKKLKKE